MIQRIQALMGVPVQDRAIIIQNVGLPAAQFTGNGPGRGFRDFTGNRTTTDLLNAALRSSGLSVIQYSSKLDGVLGIRDALSRAYAANAPMVFAGSIPGAVVGDREEHIVAAMPGGTMRVDGYEFTRPEFIITYNPSGGGYDTNVTNKYTDVARSGLPGGPSEIWTVQRIPTTPP